MFKCLPFGLSLAIRVFTKLLKPVVGFLRQIHRMSTDNILGQHVNVAPEQGATTPDHSVDLPIV